MAALVVGIDLVTSARRALALALSPRVIYTASSASLVVGCLLNAINQGAALLAFHGISWFQLALNFVVPYLVATYSAVRARLEQGDSTPTD